VYIPKHFAQGSVEAMHALMAANPFAMLITLGAEGLCANHIPMELSREPSPYGTLSGHVARSNPLWRESSNGAEALVVFQGPNAYITPSWYPSKKETGKVVPTWNYAVVHAHGQVRMIDDARWVKAHIGKLTHHQEASFAQPWAVSDAPGEYTEKMFGGVVGIEILITRLVGKWKVSQNRTAADQAGVVAGLRELGDAEALQMAELVERGTGG